MICSATTWHSLKYKSPRYLCPDAGPDSLPAGGALVSGAMQLLPLGSETLAAAQRVALELFPWEVEHQVALAASVQPAEYPAFYLDRRLQWVRGWTAHAPTGAVHGIATLYGYQAQPDEAWLAWFGLVPEARGRGAGGRLLEWLINRSRAEGRRTLRLWTTDEAEYTTAIQLYLTRGFVPEEHPPLPGEEWRTFVFSLGLDGQNPLPWAAVIDRGELCGRQVSTATSLAA